jgi:hypothetical protein
MANNIVLQLKQRKVNGMVNVPLAALKAIMATKSKDRLWEMFENIDAMNQTVHDKAWLEQIGNWAPEGGIPLKDLGPWIGLRTRIDRLDDQREGPFTLSAKQDEILWKRLTDPAFKLTNLNPQMAEFLMEYVRVSGHSFESVTGGMWDDPDEVQASE